MHQRPKLGNVIHMLLVNFQVEDLLAAGAGLGAGEGGVGAVGEEELLVGL
jgi:hypothetical protein